MLIRILLLSSGFWLGACRENPRQPDSVDSEAETTAVGQEASPAKEGGAAGEEGKEGSTEDSASPDEEVAELRREIESGRQNIEDIEAFVEMERAKVEDDPDYDRSFLLEAVDEQREIREAVESNEKRLRESTRPTDPHQ